jgi:hypothetical protein
LGGEFACAGADFEAAAAASEKRNCREFNVRQRGARAVASCPTTA